MLVTRQHAKYRKYSEWMTKPVLHKIRLKCKAWMKYKIAQSDSNNLAYM